LRTEFKYLTGTTACSLFLFFLIACEKPKTIGADIIPSDDMIGVYSVDTFTLEMETIQRDSVRTDENPIDMFGNLIDPDFGRISTSWFTQFRMGGNNLYFGDSLSLDSIVLELDLFSGFYGNLSDYQAFRIYELDQPLIREAEYYNKDSVSTLSQNNLASHASIGFASNSDFKTKIQVRLKDELGNKILNATSDQLLNNQNFLEFFKGLYIGTQAVTQSSKEPGAVYYINSNTGNNKLTLYYNGKIGGVYYDTLSYSFSVNTDCARFSRIVRTESVSKLYDEVLNGDEMYGRQYLLTQAGLGLDVFVRIPNLKVLFPATVNRVDFILPVLTEYFGANAKYSPPVNLGASYAGENKEILTGIWGTAKYEAGIQSYKMAPTNMEYFCQNVINGKAPNTGFILRSENYSTNINRVVLAGPEHPTRKPILRIFYTPPPK